MTKMNFGKYSFEASNMNKILFPGEKFTKQDLIEYYESISEYMLPHIKDRAISMQRFPNGINKKSFFQKDVSDYFPDWIKTKKIKRKEGGNVEHLICNNKATLAYLANQACITPHTWLSKINKLNYPDRLIFDLDPPGKSENFNPVKSAAKILNSFLTSELKLNIYLMTTGSKGIHIVVPITADEDFDLVRKFGQGIAKVISNRHSKDLTTEVRKNKRSGRIFIDTARNGYAQTSVPPYSVRAIKGAPVAAPLSFDELSGKRLNSQSYNIKNIFKRLENISDPWNDINQKKNSLKGARKILNSIIDEELK